LTICRSFYSKYAEEKVEKVNETIAFFETEEAINQMLLENYGVDLTAPGFGGRKIKLGEKISLDDIGPIVVNPDGTLRRITNWLKMTKREQDVALRRIAKRNKKRLAALAKQAENHDSSTEL
jgi:hypothetical protein